MTGGFDGFADAPECRFTINQQSHGVAASSRVAARGDEQRQFVIHHLTKSSTRDYLEISASAFAKEPSRSAALLALEIARAAGVTVYLDLDFRADQWHDPRAYGVTVRGVLGSVDVAIGTEEEVNAAMLKHASDITISHSQITAPEIRGDTNANVAALLEKLPPRAALVVKRGARGSSVYVKNAGRLEVIDAAGFPVEVLSILGAGDAFAAGLIYARAQGWDWRKSARMGNACGAIVVTRIGCADFTPRLEEAMKFIASHGGF